MYGAKDHGRSRAELFDSGAHDRAVTHLRTGNELHRALEALRDSGIIESQGRGEWRLSNPLLRRFIQTIAPLGS